MNKILCLNAGGIGDLHGLRARRLTRDLDADLTFFDVDKSQSRSRNSHEIWSLLKSQKWDLVYQEHTGIAGGINLIRAARAWGQRYIISSGDPVGGYFKTTRGPVYGAAFEVYEKLLYRHCAGFVGWTPYLVGMAMKMGAKKAVTVEGCVDLNIFEDYDPIRRKEVRDAFHIPDGHIVCGIVGSLNWSKRQSYSYGLELVEMLNYLRRRDVSLLIVGDGNGRAELEARVPDEWRNQVTFTGRLSQPDVVKALNAMDIGFITQTIDGLGSYRLTTKLPEYLATGLPVAMSPVPGFFDYASEAGWPLPALHPASASFHEACARWLDGLERVHIAARATQARALAAQRFDYERVSRRFHTFIEEILKG